MVLKSNLTETMKRLGPSLRLLGCPLALFQSHSCYLVQHLQSKLTHHEHQGMASVALYDADKACATGRHSIARGAIWCAISRGVWECAIIRDCGSMHVKSP